MPEWYSSQKKYNKMTLKEAKKKYPNDSELAKYFVANYEFMEDVNEFEAARVVKEIPNYYTLGDYLRNKM